VISLLVCLIYNPNQTKIAPSLLVILLPLLFNSDRRSKDYERFLATQQLKALIENKRLSEEQKQKIILRGMVRNVAHDLKKVRNLMLTYSRCY
jgi:hypothetical protein